jgi:UDP-N-acetylmuramoyl-tripeptide--D-alanyl-D-alanine ligase
VVIDTSAGEVCTTLALPGRHNLANAAAAAGAAVAMDIPPDVIGEGLARVRPVPGRLDLATAAGGHRIIDDAYNANPDSLRAGIEYLVSLPGEHWLALGAMGELGTGSASLHAEAGRQARALGVDRLFTVGEGTRPAAEAFGAGAEHFADREALIEVLRGKVHPDVCCLVKGSRSAGMERVAEALRTMTNNNGNGARESAARGA